MTVYKYGEASKRAADKQIVQALIHENVQLVSEIERVHKINTRLWAELDEAMRMQRTVTKKMSRIKRARTRSRKRVSKIRNGCVQQ